MKHALLTISLALAASLAFGADVDLERAKLELVVEQAEELLADANRKGSATHTPLCRYYFGLVYGCGTNLLARSESVNTKNLARQYMTMAEKNYEAYTKVEDAVDKAKATGNNGNGGRHRAKRIANAEKMGNKELEKAIREWETFATKLKKKR